MLVKTEVNHLKTDGVGLQSKAPGHVMSGIYFQDFFYCIFGPLLGMFGGGSREDFEI